MNQLRDLAMSISILVVDDDIIIRQSISDQLEDLGFKIMTAENGKAALELMAQQPPSLVLTDLRMPQMGGLEMIQRAREQFPDIPIIVISGAGLLGDAVAALRLGASDYLIKPINDLHILEHTIKQALEKASLQRENVAYQRHLEQLVDERTVELAKANKALRTHQARLEELVDARTAELKQSYEQLQQTQNQLIESAKMASLGGVIAGVAHEINTPIGICLTAASHLRDMTVNMQRSAKGGSLRKSLFENFISDSKQLTSHIEDNIRRASDLINRFKQLAVNVSGEKSGMINLYSFMEEVLQYLDAELKDTHTQVKLDGPKDLIIESFPGPVFQIVSELVHNSLLHAFEPSLSGHIHINLSSDNGMAVLTYQDDGKGMDKETLEQIFEPFFTTQRGEGRRGLGMHLLYNQVSQILKGKVSCSSTPGKGSVFNIVFPIKITDLQG